MSTEATAQEQAGRVIRLLRQHHQVSLRSLASTVGVSPSHLSRVENGERDMTPDLYRRVCAALAGLPAPTSNGLLVPADENVA